MWVHLDTHVVLYIARQETHRIPTKAQNMLSRARPLVSPMVLLELSLLHQVGKISQSGPAIREHLRQHIDLGVSSSSFERAALIAAGLEWTRDPFDRLIAATAMADDVPLLTRDRNLLKHCPIAVWDA